MTKTSLIISLLISFSGICQQYDGVEIEKSKIDKNNTIYTLGKEFIFNINIENNGEVLYIKNNEDDSIQITKNRDSAAITEVHLTVIKPKLFQRTNKHQTEIYYSYEPNPTSISATGIVENQKNIWLHPPRNEFFKALETCPFPYIVKDKPVGFQWKDSMSIGKHWGNKLWGEWNDRLLLNYKYEITETEILNTPFGEIECSVINAIATSELGQSRLKAYYSEEYGFVALHYTLFSGIEIDLKLDKIIEGSVLRSARDFFENRYQ